MDQASEIDRETRRAGLRVELFVSDIQRSVAFYRDVLGFDVLRKAPSGYVSVGLEGAVIGLNEVARLSVSHPVRPQPGHALGKGVELVVMVDDVAALHARATTVDEGQVSVLTAQHWGLTDFRVIDPDGYYVRITGLSIPA